ncbi:uncharacterized protein SAPINGB_P004480 [Magnusiomyces paraingens]|uniref:Uncharacterized protein n=1 Tax=Magnusiomyces paraingens TaxID=2606893 RepID=A0A5E8BUN8_9ASCO|nr:uncharacterized protein SAPINGB_P004480 [Saprochaete ingens]VVT55206.1 unnamed protein product [Saprochaete ingens]
MSNPPSPNVTPYAFPPVPSSRPPSIMLPVEESDDEEESAIIDSYSSTPSYNLTTTSHHNHNHNHHHISTPSAPSFSKKRYSNVYENVSLSSLAAAAAKEQLNANSNNLLESLLDPPTSSSSSSFSSLSASHSSSSLRSNFLHPKASTSSLRAPSLAPLVPPSAPFVPGTGHRRTVSSSSSISSLSTAPFAWPQYNSASTTPNQPSFPSSGASPYMASSSIQNSSVSLSQFDPNFLPPPPIPPFAGSSSSSQQQQQQQQLPQSGSSTPNSFRPGHSTHSSISSTYSLPMPQFPGYESASGSRPGSPSGIVPPARPVSPGSQAYQPFNFQSTTMALGGPPVSRANQRRGHKYKHSSVSLNFFKEDVRVPLQIPASLPIPTFAECRQSMSKDQLIRLLWGVCHLYMAFLIYVIESPYTALSALAHLLFYDAMGAFLCAFVDILGNFDVWKRSSVHLPFGLERTEVLAGYALAISLVFMGGDILSHSLQDIIQAVYLGDFFAASHGHGSHHHGPTDSDPAAIVINWRKICFRVILGIIATIVSAVGFDNHSRISRALKSTNASAISSLPWIMSNPSHFITVTFSFAILLYPIESPFVRRVIDTILTPLIAASMCYVGWILAKSLGGMLVMSFPGENRTDLVEEQVLKLRFVTKCSEISVWQVHHSVWLACMKIEMNGGSESDEQYVREQAARLVKEIMEDHQDDEEAHNLDQNGFNESGHRRAPSEAKTSLARVLRPLRIGKQQVYAYSDQTRWEVTIDITRK